MAQINEFNVTPRAMRIQRVLEAAIDAGDPFVIAACQRLMEADLLGFRKHHKAADWQLIKEMDEELSA